MLSMSTPLDIDNLVDELADLFHLLGDPTRLRIVLACLAQPTSVGDIAAGLALSAARIVKAERQGKQVFYTAADAHISGLLANMFEHLAEPEPANGLDT
jgi:DNA-binding transcriptional ArsR family regulator